MAHALRFDEHVKTAEGLAQEITGIKEPTNYVWLTTIMIEDNEDMRLSAPEELDPQEAVIADLLEDELDGNAEDVDVGDAEDMDAGSDMDTANAEDWDAVQLDDMRLGPSPQAQDPSDTTRDSDSDVEIVTDITMSEMAQVTTDSVRVHWTKPMVSLSCQFSVFGTSFNRL
jgi:hypothetical protein